MHTDLTIKKQAARVYSTKCFLWRQTGVSCESTMSEGTEDVAGASGQQSEGQHKNTHFKLRKVGLSPAYLKCKQYVQAVASDGSRKVLFINWGEEVDPEAMEEPCQFCKVEIWTTTDQWEKHRGDVDHEGGQKMCTGTSKRKPIDLKEVRIVSLIGGFVIQAIK